MLFASNEIAGLQYLLTAALRQGVGAQTVLGLLECAIVGLYRPRGGFTTCDLNISFLVKSLGGLQLLYALQRSHGLASYTTITQHNPIPHLHLSIGVPNIR